MLKKVAFTMYPVIDIIRARKFYEEKLKLSVGKISDKGSWVEYDLPDGGCFAIATLAEGMFPSSEAGGIIAFEVDNLDKLVSHLKAEGVKFKADIFSSPVCRMAIILDSEDNAVLLHQLNSNR